MTQALDIRPDTVLSRGQHDRADGLVGPPMSCGSRWFCVATHPSQELRAVGELANQHYRTYLPMHLARRTVRGLDITSIVPLFAGYAFCRFDPLRDAWGAIRHTRGVLALIRHAPDAPTPLPVGVIEHLQARTSARGVVDDPGEADTTPTMPVGAAVSVVGGAFDGLAGVVQMSSAQRVQVLISLLGRTVQVEIHPSRVRAAA